MTIIDKLELRRRLLTQRRSLDRPARERLSARIAQHVCDSAAFIESKSLAAYLPFANEVDALPVIEAAWRYGKTVAIPAVGETGNMRFLRYDSTTPLRRNAFGIDEPAAAPDQVAFGPDQLDLVLVPLLGFDCNGYRLGMGGGYYDRFFARSIHRQQRDSVKLLGLAYDFQQLDTLPVESWDVPLDAVATEAGITIFTAN